MNTDGGRKLAKLLSVGSMMELRIINGSCAGTVDTSISYKDALFLDTISEMEGCTLSRLAEAACVTKPTATVRVNRLVDRGMVRRIRDQEDGRRAYLELTDDVRDVYRFEEEVLQRIVSSLEEIHGPERTREFIDMVSEATALMMDISPDGSSGEKDIEGSARSPSHEDLRGLRAGDQAGDVQGPPSR